MFFSGAIIPWAVPVPVAVPWTAARGVCPPLAMTDHGQPPRVSNADSRRRAMKLVEIGDRHLRGALADRRKLSAALSAYRRAATVAPDLPDPCVREAIVLVALERHDDATRSLDRIAAIDPRLSDGVADRGMIAIRDIWNGVNDPENPDPAPAVNWIADRWGHRWHPEMAGLAAASPPDER